MPRNDTDETWERLPNGTMRLAFSATRVVSDEEIAKEEATQRLRLLAVKARDVGLTQAEQDRMLLYIARIILREL